MQLQRIICLLLFITIFSCREDFERNVSTPLPFEPTLLDDYNVEADMIIGSVKGIVVDENQNPIARADVVLNGAMSTTDKFGHFFYIDIPMNANGTVVNISSPDYQLGSKLFYPTENATENLEIMLSEIENSEEVDGLSSGTVQLLDGVSLSYPEKSFLQSDGSPYEGVVTIATNFIDAASEDFVKKAPGNMSAVDINNNLTGLVPSSLIQISVSDEQGNPLSINNDADVLISLDNNISENNDVWYYAAEFGLYTINEVNPDVTNISYLHNTSLLFARSVSSELQSITLISADGSFPLVNAEAEMLDQNNNSIAEVFSNSLGEIKMSVPEESGFNLNIKDACGNVVYQDTWPSAVNELNLDQVDVKQLDVDVYDCAVQPAENNVLRIRQGNRTQYFYQAEAQFSLALQTCDQGQAQITANENTDFDLIATASTSIVAQGRLSDLFTCEDPSINLLTLTNIESGVESTYSILSTAASDEDLTTFANDGNQGNQFRITFNGSEIGDYSDPALHSIDIIEDDAAGFRITGDAERFEVIRFGNENKISIGSFEGSFVNSLTNEIINVKGNFNFYKTE